MIKEELNRELKILIYSASNIQAFADLASPESNWRRSGWTTMFRKFLLITLLLQGGLRTGCVKMNHNNLSNESRYFESPQQAVEKITKLLKQKKFYELACYYDLNNSDWNRSILESGKFFIREKKPPLTHPAGFRRYKHPFAPGFKYQRIEPTSRDKVFRVYLAISITQGEDMPDQIGTSEFFMIKHLQGWQVLPD